MNVLKTKNSLESESICIQNQTNFTEEGWDVTTAWCGVHPAASASMLVHEGQMTYCVLAVGPAASEQQNLGALSMTVLARQVESRVSCLEATEEWILPSFHRSTSVLAGDTGVQEHLVLGVNVGPGLHQQLHRLTEAMPGHLMQSCVSILTTRSRSCRLQAWKHFKLDIFHLMGNSEGLALKQLRYVYNGSKSDQSATDFDRKNWVWFVVFIRETFQRWETT